MSDKPSRQRRGTVSLPGRGAAAAIVDAPSVVDDLRTQPMMPSSTAGLAPAVPLAAPTREPATPQPAVAAAEPAQAPPAAAPSAPPPPPKKQAPPRVQFSTKLPPALITDVKDFAEHHQAEIQIVVELAIEEYLTSRGWELSS